MNGQETHPQLAALQTRGMIAGVVGLVLCGVGYASNSEQFFHSYLTGYLYWLAIALGCIGWCMINHLTEGHWGLPARRIWEAASRTMPLLIVLFLPIVVGMDSIFSWTHPDPADEIIAGKATYLNTTFFMVRAAIFLGMWTFFGYLLSKFSMSQDSDDPANFDVWALRLRKVSGPGLLLMALTVTFYSVDWVMSLDPHWFSTLFGFLFAASDLLAAMAFTIVMVKMLETASPLDKLVKVQHYHDYGNLLMATVMLWAYMSFSQYLIIWSGNTQEEAPWYLARIGPGWVIISVILIAFHFMLPLLVLLTRRTKRASQHLVKIALYMLVMRFVDIYWLVTPSFSHGGTVELHIGDIWYDLAGLLAIGGLWLAFFAMQLKNKPLVPLKDKRLQEALEGTGGHH